MKEILSRKLFCSFSFLYKFGHKTNLIREFSSSNHGSSNFFLFYKLVFYISSDTRWSVIENDSITPRFLATKILSQFFFKRTKNKFKTFLNTSGRLLFTIYIKRSFSKWTPELYRAMFDNRIIYKIQVHPYAEGEFPFKSFA